MKVAENSTNYSINNTARHVLWLPTTREMKYKAKAAVDTLFMRVGDGLAALSVLVGMRFFGLAYTSFFSLNILLCVVWLAVAWVATRDNRRWTLAYEGQRMP